MSIKSKVFAAAATLTLVGGAGAMGAMSASAATPSCGSSCVEWFSHDFGTHAHPNFILDILRQGEKVGQPAILFRASNSDRAEDFTISEQGLVSDFYTAGLVSAALNLHYGNGEGQTATTGDLEAYEIQYNPDGVDSGLCLGTATTAAAGTKISLQPCGVSSKTVWVQDWDNAAGAHSNYVPLIAGSDTNFSQPFVMTYPATAYPTDMPRAQLYTANLTGYSNGTRSNPTGVNDNQLFGYDRGVLP
jgi:hypothetical protein